MIPSVVHTCNLTRTEVVFVHYQDVEQTIDCLEVSHIDLQKDPLNT